MTERSAAQVERNTQTMDVTFIVSAVIFTLLAIVVATSIFKGSSPAVEFANARSYFGHGRAGGLAQSRPKQNGHVAEKETKKEEADVWSEMSGSAHDHWDVVKSVLSVSYRSACPQIQEFPSINLSLICKSPHSETPEAKVPQNREILYNYTIFNDPVLV